MPPLKRFDDGHFSCLNWETVRIPSYDPLFLIGGQLAVLAHECSKVGQYRCRARRSIQHVDLTMMLGEEVRREEHTYGMNFKELAVVLLIPLCRNTDTSGGIRTIIRISSCAAWYSGTVLTVPARPYILNVYARSSRPLERVSGPIVLHLQMISFFCKGYFTARKFREFPVQKQNAE